MEKPQMFMGAGLALALAGGIPAAIGTTSTGLFLLYGAMLVSGLGLAAYGKKLRDKR